MLTENKISLDYQTSRSPVREAFKTLENEGLIEFRRMGAIVKGLSKKDLLELYDVRFLIEEFCFEKLAKHFTSNQYNQLNKILDSMEVSAKYNDHIEFSYHDFCFHDTIIRLANHERIFYLWNNIKHIVYCLLVMSTEIRFSQENKENTIKKMIEGHKLIIDTLFSQDKTLLKKVVKEHYTDTIDTVVPAYFK